MADNNIYKQQVKLGTRDLILSSKGVFDPGTPLEQNPAILFAMSLEGVMDAAPNETPRIEKILDKSTEQVRGFIKTASQLFGKISITLESI
ncbi:hypothetical protein TVAG_191400 [Trichomonas vaginalis G3]|uniref:Uncharacterized protein n=1 Tax=Trichomonas vaginalis (strain ATCC PRA-98 / G3) TaxID=412133 RepID=A2EQJ6_TRIV3|nr:hypothetical protein TVAGG3_0976370 [Trichomonas vaginalis G3]EAY05043.1 hypothetical protein TVAG_191400 [Trichomonas vaginalis G3]KAI5488960.1 hypothetical protein TVAGG3_0976370 [Trichomonas vaginalis G3]|eukprot:XP_001317266.1 hypothetical protein [Trichomonas vaginalis G3]